MSVEKKGGREAAKAFASVAASYVEAGAAPVTVAIAMAGEAAAIIARMTSPSRAARMLRTVADRIEGPPECKSPWPPSRRRGI
jgi:hypothetical protein